MGIKKVLAQEKTIIIGIVFSLLFISLLFPYVWRNPYIEHIPFAVLDEDNSALSRKLTEMIKSSNGLEVEYYPSSEEELGEAIKLGKVYGGIVIPKNFSRDVSLKKSPKCLITIDGSNVIVGGNTLKECATVIGTVSAGTQLKILEGSGMNPTAAQTSLGSFSVVDRTVYETTGGYTPRMFYTLVPLIIQQSVLLNFLMPMLMRRRFEFMRGSKKENIANIKDIVLRIAVVFFSSIVISFGALLLVGIMRGLPLRGDILVYFVLMLLFLLNCLGVAIFLCAIARSGTIIAWVYGLISNSYVFLSGVAYPFFMMPDWVNKLAHCIYPMAQLAIPLKALNLKGIGFAELMPDIISSIKFSLFWIPFGIGAYIFSIYLMKRKLNKKQLVKQNRDNQLAKEGV